MDNKEKNAIYLKVYQASVKSLQDLGEVEVLTPQQTDLYRTKLAALYALLSEEMGQLEKVKPIEWLQIKNYTAEDVLRDKPLSDKHTDTVYDATEKGQRRVELKFHLKALEKMISALASRMHRLHQEAKNEGLHI